MNVPKNSEHKIEGFLCNCVGDQYAMATPYLINSCRDHVIVGFGLYEDGSTLCHFTINETGEMQIVIRSGENVRHSCIIRIKDDEMHVEQEESS